MFSSSTNSSARSAFAGRGRALSGALKWAALPFLFVLGGCQRTTMFDPAGWPGTEEKALFVLVGSIMLCVLAVVYFLLAMVLWRYRVNNPKGDYAPDWDDNKLISGLSVGIPILIVTFFAYLAWTKTHELDPYNTPPNAKGPEVRINAIAYNWKWLFIYPDLGIATVNDIAVPQGAPVRFYLTSDVAMASFMIKELTGQINAMAGMQTQLTLRADRLGSYWGRNMMFSGDGFPEQFFNVHVLDEAGYKQWVEKVKASPDVLDGKAVTELEKWNTVPGQTTEEASAPPSGKIYPAKFFSSVSSDVFMNTLMKYSPYPMKMGQAPDATNSAPQAVQPAAPQQQ